MYVFTQEDCSIEEHHCNSDNQFLVFGASIFSCRFENSNSVFLGQNKLQILAGARLLMHLCFKLAFFLALLTDKLSQPSELRRYLELVS